MGQHLQWLLLAITPLSLLVNPFGRRSDATTRTPVERRRTPRIPGPRKDRDDRYYQALREALSMEMRQYEATTE